MAIPNPDALWFQYFEAGGAAQIALEEDIEAGDWEFIARNDVYLWSYLNRRTFWSFGDFNNTIQTGSIGDTIVIDGLWSLSTGRVDILAPFDIQNCALTIRLYDNGGVNFDTQVAVAVARAQSILTFAAVASTALEGYFTVEMRTNGGSPAQLFGLKLIEQRIAQADL
jgi:hypothetical protein